MILFIIGFLWCLILSFISIHSYKSMLCVIGSVDGYEKIHGQLYQIKKVENYDEER